MVRCWVSLGHAASGVAQAWGGLLASEARVFEGVADMLAVERRGPQQCLLIGELAHRWGRGLVLTQGVGGRGGMWGDKDREIGRAHV